MSCQEDETMKRLVTVAVLLAVAPPTRAHFVWILPPDQEGQPARVVFSDSLQPDKPELLKKIAHTELFFIDKEGKTTPVKLTGGKDALEAALTPGQGSGLLAGVCRYGVVQRGQTEPFLLLYYPKSVVNISANGSLRTLLTQACDKLPLQVVAGDGTSIRVLWQGKPLAGAEVMVLKPGQEKPTEGKSDSEGSLQLGEFGERGLVGIRVSHVEATAGELNGKAYKLVKHYATLTFPLKDRKSTGNVAPGVGTLASLFFHDGYFRIDVASKAVAIRTISDEGSKPAENPAATKLLADARAARANWENFPGFSADLEVNLDGKVTRGTMSVDPKGKVALQLNDPAAAAWAKRMLGSIVGHRLDDGSDLHTPCAFADDVTDHPLGRAIRVLNDEFHSSYRIRDRQVIEVNRVMKDARFTITVIENRLNAEKQYLPSTYVVNYWDTKSGALKTAEGHQQTWQRVGRFDLPSAAMVVSSTPGKQETKELKLTNVRLLEGTH
jgi:uncharacterized GH25 family protein